MRDWKLGHLRAGLVGATLLATPPGSSYANKRLTAPTNEAVFAGTSARAPTWTSHLRQRIAAIDEVLPGELGVYVKRPRDGSVLSWNADRRWYLASTVKVPVAIAVLERVATGELSLEGTVQLLPTDYVDGAGDMKGHTPGRRFAIAELIAKSLENSDSIATDMLIRSLGEDELNRRVRSWTGGGFGPLTSLLQVRYDVYGLLSPRVAGLPNHVFLSVRAAGDGEARLTALAAALGLTRDELPTDGLEALFERYYERGVNAARLDAFGELLEQLAAGRLLPEPHTARMLLHMQRIVTGQRRIQAGLPPGVPFAQKTGTQIARACNVGVVYPRDAQRRVIVAACAARFERLAQAERAFRSLGRALGEVGLVGRDGAE